jgi:ribonuclease D
MIDTQDTLEDICAQLSAQPFITVDTEFLRERTYWPQLCLIQVGWKNGDDVHSALIDPLCDLDLQPLYNIFTNKNIVKVFHAARQDIEIFHHIAGVIPEPLFDTQVAGMVCGHGEQVSYASLVNSMCGIELDKNSRVTDWSQRPLSEDQQTYARADVTYLCDIYEMMSKQLEENQRKSWVQEELAILYDPQTYLVNPEEAWQRIKIRNLSPKNLAVLYELAKWREETAQDVSRGRILKDETLVDIAATSPKNLDSLLKVRSLQRERINKETESSLLAAVQRGLETPVEERPHLLKPTVLNEHQRLQKDLLQILLALRAAEMGVASRLIADSSNLSKLVLRDETFALTGWREEFFGRDAVALLNGALILKIQENNVVAEHL